MHGGINADCRRLKAVCENKCSIAYRFSGAHELTSGESQPLSQRRVDIAVIFPDRGRIPDTPVNRCYEREYRAPPLVPKGMIATQPRPPASLREAKERAKEVCTVCERARR